MKTKTDNRSCRTCGRRFTPSSRHLDCPSCRGDKARETCPSCGKLMWKNASRCVKCSNSNRTGEDSPTWKGGRISHQGYVMLLDREHARSNPNGYVLEHIVVMEEKLGRPLQDGENVHHINGVKDDNRPENLELWTRPQPTGARAKDLVDWAVELLKLYAPDKLK